MNPALQRSREELGAATTLVEAGYFNAAVSRAYYACFYAAEAALLAIGESRSKHAGVIAAFGKHVVKEKGFDPDIARSLRDLFELRNRADYEADEPPADVVRSAIQEASQLVDAVTQWLDSQ